MKWHKMAQTVRWNVQPFIGGQYRPSLSRETIDNINPATETPLCRIPVGDAADIDEAVKVARRAFNSGCWSELAPGKRGEILAKFADLLSEKKMEFALLDSLEMGKPMRAALFDTGNIAPQKLRTWAGFADKLVGVSEPLSSGTAAFNTYEPRGVVGAIIPWNFPTAIAAYKCGAALAAGNTVVLKPSELSPSSALKFAELAMEAGVPEGVLNVVPGLGPTVGTALALHPDVDVLSFTGSTITGRKIMECAGRSNGKPVLMECGGKSPHVVFGDVADLDVVADATVKSVVWNQGQVCSARTRLIAHSKVLDALLAKVIARAREYQPGDPLDESTTFGPLASPRQRDRVRSYIEAGLQAGARAVLRGPIQERGGCYVSPTIFDRVDSSMSIVREEIFGPVLCVQSFETEAQAIALANATDYGLEATVWTRDIGLGRRCAHSIRAGEIYVRTSGSEEPESGFVLSREPQKASGFGSESGIAGMKSYSTLKLVSFAGA
jgi:acyl-CoA reductase-like NAD-dependent aldehyde dehydrogenase